MLAVVMDPKTKVLSIDKSTSEDLTATEVSEAEHLVSLINLLVKDFVPLNKPFPPPGNQVTQKHTQAAQQLAKNGVQAIQQKKTQEAIKILKTALEIVLRRPYWESVALTLEEVVSCLSPLCDAYSQGNMWPEAYGLATMLTLLKPQDASHLYRRAYTLMAVERYEDAREVVETGLSMNANEPLFKEMRDFLDKQKLQLEKN